MRVTFDARNVGDGAVVVPARAIDAWSDAWSDARTTVCTDDRRPGAARQYHDVYRSVAA